MTEQNLPTTPAEVEIEEIIPTEAIVEEVEIDTEDVVEEDDDDDDDDDDVDEDDDTNEEL